MKILPLFIGAVLLLCTYCEAAGQTFDKDVFWEKENLIDTLLAHEEYSAAVAEMEKQIAYLKATDRIDSLWRYTYYLGHAYFASQGRKVAMEKTEAYVEYIIQNVKKDKRHHLHALNDLGWVYIEMGEDSLCYQVDMRYLELCLAYPEALPIDISTAHYAVGYDYEALFGNAKKAIYHFQKSLEPIKGDTLNNIDRILDCYNALGAAYFRNGEYQKSKDALYKALYFSKKLEDSVDVWLHQANIYGNLSLGAQDLGNLVQCKDYLYRTLQLRKKASKALGPGYKQREQQRLLINGYHNLAALNLHLGDIAKAETISKYVQELRERQLVEDHPKHKQTYENFGSIHYSLGEYNKALENFEKYLAECLKDYGKYSYYTGTAYQRIAKTLQELGDYKGAIANYGETISIAKEVSQAYSGQELAQAYMLRAIPQCELKDFDAAENDIRSALAIFASTRDLNSPIFGNLYNTMADIKMKRGDLDSAHFYVDKALVLMLDKQREQKKKYGGDLSGKMDFLPRAYYTKAMLVKLQNPEDKLNEEALNYLQKGVDYLLTSGKSFSDRTSLLLLYKDHQDLFHAVQDACIDLYESHGDQEYLNKLMTFTEENRSILLRRQLNYFTSLRVYDVPDSIIVKERKLLAEMSGEFESDDPERDIPAIEAEYQKLVASIKSAHPDYYKLRYSYEVASLDKIKQLTGSGRNIVEFVLTEGKAYAIVLTPKSAVPVKLNSKGLEAEMNSYLNAVQSQDRSKISAASFSLYRRLFEPLEEHFTGKEILIIPDKDLFNVNFEALQRNKEVNDPDYLIYDYTISYLLSATTALQYKKLKNRNKEGLLAFAPGFFDELKTTYLSLNADTAFIDQKYLRRIQQPFAVETAREAAGMFSGAAFLTAEATEANFKKEAAKYSVIHLGTHTEINDESPLLSRLILSKPFGEETEENDGYLHAYEIYNLGLKAELAVLTACETGVGQLSSGEGVMSLAHSFAYAGCPSVVMSLWQIDEKTSAGIIDSFYENLSQGMSKNEALREAKLSYLKKEKGGLDAPYYWSGIVLLGDVEPLSTTDTDNYWILFLSIGLILIFFIYRRKKLQKE